MTKYLENKWHTHQPRLYSVCYLANVYWLVVLLKHFYLLFSHSLLHLVKCTFLAYKNICCLFERILWPEPQTLWKFGLESY